METQFWIPIIYTKTGHCSQHRNPSDVETFPLFQTLTLSLQYDIDNSKNKNPLHLHGISNSFFLTFLVKHWLFHLWDLCLFFRLLLFCFSFLSSVALRQEISQNLLHCNHISVQTLLVTLYSEFPEHVMSTLYTCHQSSFYTCERVGRA